MGVPVPTLCQEERQRRRLAWRNERNLFQKKCSGTGNPILSVYREESPFPVYEQSYFHSDSWDPKTYGQDYDFSKPFFEQFFALQQRVPHINLIGSKNENSDYVNYAGSNKNCFLL